MSPKGLHAPPAFAATIIFTNAGTINALLPLLTANATVDMRSALVRLSANGDKKNVMIPVAQNSLRNPNPLPSNQARRHWKTFLSSNALIYVIATKRKKKSSPISPINSLI